MKEKDDTINELSKRLLASWEIVKYLEKEAKKSEARYKLLICHVKHSELNTN